MADLGRQRCLFRWFRSARRVAGDLGATQPVVDLEDVKGIVDSLELPATVAPATLAELLSRMRDRPIKILPYPDAIVAESRRTEEPLPYGVWIADAAADYVFYRTDTTSSHQRHIILHELGHICCRHVGTQIGPTQVADDTPDQAAITNAVKRAGGFAEDQETAVETFAYLVERQTRPNLSASGDTPVARFRLLED